MIFKSEFSVTNVNRKKCLQLTTITILKVKYGSSDVRQRVLIYTTFTRLLGYKTIHSKLIILQDPRIQSAGSLQDGC